MTEQQDAGVLVSSSNGIRTITLNRPQSANALRPVDRDAVIAALATCDGDPSVRVVVIASAGRHFCAGADVKSLADSRLLGEEQNVGDLMRKLMTGAQRLIAAVLDCGKPVIARVQGPAAGIGAHLAFAADLTIAGEEASFAESFVRRGMVVDGGGAYLLTRCIGLSKAKELAFFGDTVSAAEALELGLINRVVSADKLDTVVAEFAQRLAEAPTSALALTKKLFNSALDVDRASSFMAEAMAQEMQSHADDLAEGVRAFVERRPPEYRGH